MVATKALTLFTLLAAVCSAQNQDCIDTCTQVGQDIVSSGLDACNNQSILDNYKKCLDCAGVDGSGYVSSLDDLCADVSSATGGSPTGSTPTPTSGGSGGSGGSTPTASSGGDSSASSPTPTGNAANVLDASTVGGMMALVMAALAI